MKIYTKFLLGVLALFVLALGLTSIARAGVYYTPRVRVAHAVVSAPPADVYLDNQVFFQNVPYANVRDYKTVAAGTHLLRVFVAGTQQPATPEQNYTFGNNQDYTLVAFGQANSLDMRSFTDDNAIPNAGQTKVRIIHASPNLPAINICISSQGQCWVSTLAFKNASTYFPTAAGVYTLEVRQTDNRVLWTGPALKFEAGVVYTVFLMGLNGGDPGLQFIPVTDDIRAPYYPPETGAFLSPEAIVVVMVAGLILLTVIGLIGWRLARRRVN